MFFLVSGSSGSGKTSVLPGLSARFEALACYDDDENHVPDEYTRCALLEGWVQRALAHQQQGLDFLLAGQSPLGELLACPSAPRLAGISAALLDCRDTVRIERIRQRGFEGDWRPGQDDLNWASWQRMHAWDSQWEQHVILGNGPADHDYGRWKDWDRGDPRWLVRVMDTSDMNLDQVVDQIADWIEAVRGNAPVLSDESKWWV